MEELSEFLRDFHCGEKIDIDVGVVDFLARVMREVGETRATILSAYRTPQTNAMLAKHQFGVAENSQHLNGRALDVRFGDKLADAMKAARAMQCGGVGWYPHSSFMHIDTGPVRNWDLDRKDLGILLVGGQRVRFNTKGQMLDAKSGRLVNARMPTVLRGEPPPGVRGRLVRLRELARAQYFARKH
jgi:hypothetical protein